MSRKNNALREEVTRLREEVVALGDLYLNDKPRTVRVTPGYDWGVMPVAGDLSPGTYRVRVALQVPDEPFEWKTREGDLLRPAQMDEQHLRNCISYTQRRLQSMFGSTAYLDATRYMARAFYEFLREADRRGLRV
jgi:hypothetical protein